MHMGSAAVLASLAPRNLTHIILNNGAHDSVGGQPTIGFNIDVPRFASAAGYAHTARADNELEVSERLKELVVLPGPRLLEIRVALGARPDLGRPHGTPRDNKAAFMHFLQAAPIHDAGR